MEQLFGHSVFDIVRVLSQECFWHVICKQCYFELVTWTAGLFFSQRNNKPLRVNQMVVLLQYQHFHAGAKISLQASAMNPHRYKMKLKLNVSKKKFLWVRTRLKRLKY